MTLSIVIRPREPEELAVEVEIFNSALPDHLQREVERMRAAEQLTRPEDQELHLLAIEDGRAIGAGRIGYGRISPPGRFEMSVAVRPEFRGHGIGARLYSRLLIHAAQCGGKNIEVAVEEPDLPPVAAWLAREGFREVNRKRASHLRLTGFDFDAFQAAEQRILDQGMVLTTVAEESGEGNRRKLWELMKLAVRDVPLDEGAEEMSFERFEDLLDAPHYLPDCSVIARDGDRYAGFTLVSRSGPARAGTGITGVDPAYRGRGVAQAIKVRSARLLHARGFETMGTSNHVSNEPMLAVNRKMGYVSFPDTIYFVKSLLID